MQRRGFKLVCLYQYQSILHALALRVKYTVLKLDKDVLSSSGAPTVVVT